MATSDFLSFKPRNGFVDDVHGEILLSDFERMCVDSPEFQRIFRISQLGFIDLIFQTANHTRGAHSIGVCHMAELLMINLEINEQRVSPTPPKISPSERVLIRLGALLHDISHGPFSHDIERKSHKLKNSKVKSAYGAFPKHDEWQENPALFRQIFNLKESVLARILESFSLQFSEMLVHDSETYPHLVKFVKLLDAMNFDKKELLPQLLFHLLAFENEKEKEAESGTLKLLPDFNSATIEWYLGYQPDPKEARRRAQVTKKGESLHDAWYQPYRHDIIGNTLSADLLDYLQRDVARMKLGRGLDMHLLQDYRRGKSRVKPSWFRCAINLWDDKRGCPRPETLNDLFRLLDLRQEIHAKAVFHRLAFSATAMLARALLIAEDNFKLGEFFSSEKNSIALLSDEYFFIRISQLDLPQVRDLVARLAERRIFRPLMLISESEFLQNIETNDDDRQHEDQKADKIRNFAAMVDSVRLKPFFLAISFEVEDYLSQATRTLDHLNQRLQKIIQDDGAALKAMDSISSRVIIWTSPYKQLHKDPDILINTNSGITTIQDLSEGETDPLKPLAKASLKLADERYACLWKTYVFMDDRLFSRNSILDDIFPDRKVTDRLKEARLIFGRAFVAAWAWMKSKTTTHRTDWASELTQDCSVKDFQELSRNFIESKCKDAISTLDIEKYYHQEPVESSDSGCRDIRHHFPAPFDPSGTGRFPNTQVEEQFTAALNLCGIKNRTSEEVSEVCRLLSQPGILRLKRILSEAELTANRNATPISVADLRSLFENA